MMSQTQTRDFPSPEEIVQHPFCANIGRIQDILGIDLDICNAYADNLNSQKKSGRIENPLDAHYVAAIEKEYRENFLLSSLHKMFPLRAEAILDKASSIGEQLRKHYPEYGAIADWYTQNVSTEVRLEKEKKLNNEQEQKIHNLEHFIRNKIVDISVAINEAHPGDEGMDGKNILIPLSKNGPKKGVIWLAKEGDGYHIDDIYKKVPSGRYSSPIFANIYVRGEDKWMLVEDYFSLENDPETALSDNFEHKEKYLQLVMEQLEEIKVQIIALCRKDAAKRKTQAMMAEHSDFYAQMQE